jgi:hypothetical protein
MSVIKKLAALILALVLAGTLTACAAGPASTAGSSAPIVLRPMPPAPAPKPESRPPQLEPLPLAVGVNALTGLPAPEGMADGQRPVAVMVSNNQLSYPQRGLAAADVMVEALTEGGITRLMALYANYSTLPQIGPVRSTRDQFVQLALPLDAIQVSIGSSVTARNLLAVTATKTVDGVALGSTSFWFDEVRTRPRPSGKPNEYCWFTDAQLVWNGMEYLDILTTGAVPQLFRFAQEPSAPGADATSVEVTYSDVAYSGFVYNADSGLYDKTTLGNWHMDEDGSQYSFTNVILLSCGIGMKPDGVLSEFDFTEGGGWYFTAGGAQPLRWQKGGETQPLRLLDEAGNELEVQPGKSYIGFVPSTRENAVVFHN